MFSSIGAWKDVERRIEGGGGNPPFNEAFIEEVLEAFDMGARSSFPYCRCVILPLGKSYRTIPRTSSLCSKGILIVRIPTACLPFQRKEGFFQYRPTWQSHEFQELGLFVWINREYMLKYPPAQDVELLYYHWIYRACVHPSQVEVYLDAFKEAFPISLRSARARLPLLTIT